MKRRLFLHIYFAVIVILFAVFSLHTIFAAAPTRTGVGIDVSAHDGDIDWNKIKSQYNAGTLDFVIIKCGSGISKDDAYWKTNANACERLGIPFGVYLYSYAEDVDDAAGEAEHVLRLIDGYNLSYPVYYDIENSTQEKLGAKALKDICKTFCDRIKAAGYEVGVYSNLSWLTDPKLLGGIDFAAENYSVWVAKYGSSLNYSGTYDIWQYSETGVVDGIYDPKTPNDYADMNYLYIEPRTANHCYVSFDMGEASGAAPSPIHLEKGSSYGELPVPRATDGKNFCGWYTSIEGGRKIDASDLLDKAGKLTLYAHWYYKVEFEFEHAAPVGPAVFEVTKDNPFQPLTITANEGYFLPDVLIGLPEGLTYTRSADKRSAAVSGNVTDNLSLKVTALPELDRRIVFDGEYISTGLKNETFTVDGEKVAADSNGVLKIEEKWLGKTITVVFPRGDATINLSLPARRDIPAGLIVVHETLLGKGDGEIVGLDSTMEYSIDGGETFTAVGDGVKEFICGVKYIIRYKATDRDFCGKRASTTIRPGRELVVKFVAEGSEDMIFKVAYGDVVEVPELPVLDHCDMEKSFWDKDLVDLPVTEDVTVTAVYQKLGCFGIPLPLTATAFWFAVSTFAFVIFKRKH